MAKHPNRQFKDAIYEQISRIGKAVASPKRLELLDLLCQSPKTVETLATEAAISLANCSQHLKALRAARLVDAEKKGLYVQYRLADSAVCAFFRSMRLLAENRLAEIEMIKREFFQNRECMEPVDGKALLARVRKGSVVVLDVRPEDEYRTGHIPGALSVPLSRLKEVLSELPKDQQIVAYCRGPYCVLSVEAVGILCGQGFNAVRLEEGVEDWRAMGLPVAAGHSR